MCVLHDQFCKDGFDVVGVPEGRMTETQVPESDS